MEEWKKFDLECMVVDCKSLIKEISRKIEVIETIINADGCNHSFDEYQIIIDGEAFKECTKCKKMRKCI